MTLFSVNFGATVTGAIITETVFTWHGMGILDPRIRVG